MDFERVPKVEQLYSEWDLLWSEAKNSLDWIYKHWATLLCKIQIPIAIEFLYLHILKRDHNLFTRVRNRYRWTNSKWLVDTSRNYAILILSPAAFAGECCEPVSLQTLAIFSLMHTHWLVGFSPHYHWKRFSLFSLFRYIFLATQARARLSLYILK